MFGIGMNVRRAYGTPKELVDAVRSGSLVVVNGWPVGVVDYLNLGHKDSNKTKAAWAFKDFLLGLRHGSANVAIPSGVELVHVFSGKATLAELNKVFAFIDDKIDTIAKTKHLPGWPTGRTLQQIIDAGENYLHKISEIYCGFDCNGYVGLFLFEKTSLPSNIGPDTSIDTYPTMHPVYRESISEISENDLIIWSNKSHIAIISDTGDTVGDSRRFGICQSTGKSPRTGDEGPQYEKYLVKATTKLGGHMQFHVQGAIVGGDVQIMSLGL